MRMYARAGVCVSALIVLAAAAAGQNTRFTYQGQLKDGGIPVVGTVDLKFKLWTEWGGGVQVGPTLFFDGQAGHYPPVEVLNGLLAVPLDFGEVFYFEQTLYLEISVRNPHDSSNTGPYDVLSPRQEVTPSPYAMYAQQAGTLVPPVSIEASLSDTAVTISNTGSGAALRTNSTLSSYAVHAVRGEETEYSANNPAIYAESANTAYGLIGTGYFGGVGAFTVNGTDYNSIAMVAQADDPAHTGLHAYNYYVGHDVLLASPDAAIEAYAGTDGQAAILTGNAHVTGEITTEYSTGVTDMAVPIAYGFVNSSGTLANGTPNVTSSYDGSRYVISIDGESYFFNEYVTVITLASGPKFVRTDSVSGNLLVFVYSTSGSATTGSFQFVTYRTSGAAAKTRVYSPDPSLTDGEYADQIGHETIRQPDDVDVEALQAEQHARLEKLREQSPCGSRK